ncbi:MAG: hypothetical protein J7493_07810 [Porphyrobacter sp.]|nr:hypothetical protein [Porphyrobacter sp.]
MRKLLSACSLLGLIVAPAVHAQDAGVFKPKGSWTADYGEDYCRLVRTFSDGKDELSLALERIQPGNDVRMIFVGGGLSPYRNADTIGYQFGPSGTAAKSGYVKSNTADGKQFVSFNPVTLAPLVAPGAPMPAFDPTKPFVPPPYNRAKEQEAATGVSMIALSEGLTSPVKIETGSLRAPMAAMQTCADDLLKVWGLDPEKHKTMIAPVALNPNPQGVLPQGTVPFSEFSKLAGGGNQVRVIVGADGKPTSCKIYSPTLSESINTKICNLVMEKASFVPAKDAGGQAMASFWMGSPMFLGPPMPGGRR